MAPGDLEQAFTLLIIQVAGRAGRAERPGTVYVQTYQPENPVLGTLLRDGYGAFAREELARRAEAELVGYGDL